MTKMVHLKATPSFREYTSPCTFRKFQIGKYIFASHHEMTKIMRTACKNKTVSITKVVNRILHKNISHVSNLSNQIVALSQHGRGEVGESIFFHPSSP